MSDQTLSPSVSEIVNGHKNDGNDSFRSGDYVGAIVHYSQALEHISDLVGQDRSTVVRLHSVLLSNRSACHLKLSNVDQARQDAEEAIRTDRTYWKSYLRLSRTHLLTEDYILAASALMRCPSSHRPDALTSELQRLLQLAPPGSSSSNPTFGRQCVVGEGTVSDWPDVELLLREEFLWSFSGGIESDWIQLLRGLNRYEHLPLDVLYGLIWKHRAVSLLQEEEGEGEEENDILSLCRFLLDKLLRRWCIVRDHLRSGSILPKLVGFLEGIQTLSQFLVIQRITAQKILCDETFLFETVRSDAGRENILEVAFVIRRLVLGCLNWNEEDEGCMDRTFTVSGLGSNVLMPSSIAVRLAPRLQCFGRLVRSWIRRVLGVDHDERAETSLQPWALGDVTPFQEMSRRGVGGLNLPPQGFLIDVHDDLKLKRTKEILRDWSVALSGFVSSSRPEFLTSVPLDSPEARNRGTGAWFQALKILGRSKQSSEIFSRSAVYRAFRECLLTDMARGFEIVADAVDGLMGYWREEEDEIEDLEMVKQRIGEILEIVSQHASRLLSLDSPLRFLSNVVLFDEALFGESVSSIIFPDLLRDSLAELRASPERTPRAFELCRLVAVISTCSSLSPLTCRNALPRAVLELLQRSSELDQRTQHVLWQAQQSILTATRLHSLRSVSVVDRHPALEVIGNPTVGYIPPIPPSDSDDWRPQDRASVFRKCCRTAYLSPIEGNTGMAIIVRCLPMPTSIGGVDLPPEMRGLPPCFLVMCTVSFFTNQLREFGLLPLDPDQMFQFFWPMFIDRTDPHAIEDPARYAMKSFVPLSDKTYMDLITTAYSISADTREMSADEGTSFRFLGAFFEGMELQVKENLVDVLVEAITDDLDALGPDDETYPPLSFADMRSLMTSPQFRYCSLSRGDYLEAGIDPPRVAHTPQGDWRSFEAPLPKAIHDHVVQMCELSRHSPRLIRMLTVLAKCQAFFFSKFGEHRIVRDFLATAQSLENPDLPVVEIPFAASYFERSAYYFSSQFRNLVPATLRDLWQELFTIDQIIQHLIEKSREFLSVFDYPRVPWMEVTSERLTLWVHEYKRSSPATAPTKEEFSRQIHLAISEHHEHYDPGNLERALQLIVPPFVTFLQIIWANVQTVPKESTRNGSEIANVVNRSMSQVHAGARARARDVFRPRFCACCSREALMACQGCSMVHYCSMQCARVDWERHAESCRGSQQPSSEEGE